MRNTVAFCLYMFLVTGGCMNTPASFKDEEEKALKIKWFTDARYGMFIHWAPSCIYGGEISWSRSGDSPESTR